MSDREQIEAALRRSVESVTAGSPPRLAEAVKYAVLSGGGRIRPRLVLAAARVCAASSISALARP